MKRSLHLPLCTLTLTPIVLSISQPAQAFELVRRFTSSLDASQEVDESTSTATGFATLDLLQDNNNNFALKYEVVVTPELDFTALNNETAPTKGNDIIFFHLHAGASRGANGELPFPIKELRQDDLGNYFVASDLDDNLVIDIANEGTTITGLLEEAKGEFVATESFSDFPSLVEELLSVSEGDTSLYWNIHSLDFPGGAIRGQVAVGTPEPTSLLSLLSLGLLGFSCVKNKQKIPRNS
ncbi:MAG: CHRD domain-containing protein [Xenococcaceae cyanobacterium MO_188.B29]|nr:CHRD domain-containing protein [Xenococcaceae cyanobacterium MO_188.B29]